MQKRLYHISQLLLMISIPVQSPPSQYSSYLLQLLLHVTFSSQLQLTPHPTEIVLPPKPNGFINIIDTTNQTFHVFTKTTTIPVSHTVLKLETANY